MNLLSGHECKVEAGVHQYPFSFQLPNQLPTSFEGQYGNVRYYVQAKADRPWAFDYKFKAGFTVNAFVDLNQIPDAAVSFPSSVYITYNAFVINLGFSWCFTA